MAISHNSMCSQQFVGDAHTSRPSCIPRLFRAPESATTPYRPTETVGALGTRIVASGTGTLTRGLTEKAFWKPRFFPSTVAETLSARVGEVEQGESTAEAVTGIPWDCGGNDIVE